MMTWPKPVQKPHPPVILGGMFPHGARRACATATGGSRICAGRNTRTSPTSCRNSTRWRGSGRDPAEVPVTVWGVPEYDRLKRYGDQGVARGVVQLAPDGPTRPCRSLTAGPS